MCWRTWRAICARPCSKGASNFLVVGLTGLAAEACKNVVLAGIGTMRVYDDGTTAAEGAPGNFLAGAGAAEDPTLRCARVAPPGDCNCLHQEKTRHPLELNQITRAPR